MDDVSNDIDEGMIKAYYVIAVTIKDYYKKSGLIDLVVSVSVGIYISVEVIMALDNLDHVFVILGTAS